VRIFKQATPLLFVGMVLTADGTHVHRRISSIALLRVLVPDDVGAAFVAVSAIRRFVKR
jgi:hypothetical protein